MQKFLRILAFMALMCVPWMANAQETLTVCENGTDKNSNVPFYGLYADTYGAASECVIPSDMLEEMAGGTITAVKFYIGTVAGAAWTGTHQVYIGEVDATTLTGITGPESFTIVQTASFDATGNELEIVFDVPYTYEGGNLLIGTFVSVAGNWKSAYFYGVNQTENTSWYRNSATAPGSGVKFIPKTTFTYEPAATGGCEKPETIAVSNITTNTAYVTWTGGSGSFNIEYKKSSDAEWTSAASNVGWNYMLVNLDANTTYNVRVQSICDNELSGWKSATFTTANPCAVPTNLQVSNIGVTSATLTWTAGYQETSWTVKYKKSTETSWDNAQEETANGTPSITLSNLDGLTVYNVRVYNCENYVEGTFTTAVGLPFNEAFGTSLPTGWAQYSGLLANILAGSANLTTSGYAWSFGTGNNVFDNHARTNIYGTSCNKWLVTPAIPLTGVQTAQLTFDLALTVYTSGSSASPTAGNQADDKFVVLVSTDNGTTWTILRQWDNAGSEYVYDNITNAATGEAVAIDLTEYIGQSVMIAFYGESTTNGGDNNLHIDNVSVAEIPNCPKPTGLAASNVTAHGATLNWTSDAQAWQICVDNNQTNLINVTTKPYTLSGLTAESAHTAMVRANCGGGSYSDWTSAVNFTTTIACPAPTGLAAQLTPGNGSIATLTWTAGDASNWVLQYGTSSSFDGATSVEVSGNAMESLTGLTAEQTYYARVKAVCGGDDGESAWSSTITFTPTNSYSITINDGTSTNSIIPIYGYWVDNSDGTRSQFIIPAADLEAIQWGTVNQLTFYASNASVSWGNAQFEVYMAEVDNTTLSALADWEDMELAMNAASLSISGNQMVVTLDAPYQYMGGNLMIGFKQTVSGSYVSCNWYGVSATSGASFGGYSTSVSAQSFLPKMTIDYEPGEEPSCLKPTGLAVNCTGTTATVTWNMDPTADVAYMLYYGVQGATNMSNIDNVTSPYELTGLEFGTTYNVQLQAVCGGDGESDMTNPVSFTTDLCSQNDMCDITIVLNDSYGDGWNGNVMNVVDAETENVLGSYTISSGAEETYTLGVCNGRTINFVYVHGSFPTENGWVITDINDEVIAEHEGCNDGCQHDAGVIATYEVSCAVTNCKTPVDLAASEIGPHSAQLSWTEKGTATSWVVAYAFAGEFVEVPASTNPFVLTGLDPETTYTAKVRPVCEDEAIKWSATIEFTTSVACPKPTALTVNPNPTSAQVSWNGFSESYELQYTENVPLPGTVVADPVEMYYDNGTFATSIGLGGGEFSWGIMFPAGTFEGNHLFQVSVYDPTAMTGTLNIYNDGETEPSDLISTQNIEFTGATDFVEFGTDATFDNSKNLWVIFYNASGVAYPAACSADESEDPNGRWVEINGTWYDLADAGVSDRCFMIHAFVDAFDENNYEWTTVENVTSPYTIQGLTDETQYYVRVKGDCGNDGESNWTYATFTTPFACETPTDLTATNVTATTATLGWSDYQDGYNVRYRTAEAETVIFSDDFENGIGDEWTILHGEEAEAPSGGYWYTIDPTSGLSFDAHGGTQCASSWSWNNSAYQADNYLVTPLLDLQGTLKYWERTSSGYPDSYEVLLSLDGNTLADFAEATVLREMAVCEGQDVWNEISIDLSEYAGQQGYIAIHHVDYDENYLVIDDFGVYGVGTPAGEWVNMTDVENNTVNLEDLTPATTYEFQVQGICNADMNTEWSEMATFTTAEPAPTCQAPTDVEVSNITTTTATLSWTDNNDGEATYVVTDGENVLTVNSLTATGCTVTGLTPGTQYSLTLAASCSADDMSEVYDVPAFTTLCNSYNLPYTTDFGDEEASNNCWTLVPMDEGNDVVIDNGYLVFSSFDDAEEYDQYAISPVFNHTGNTPLVFEMDYATYGPQDQLWIGYTTENNAELEDFTFLETAYYSEGDEWEPMRDDYGMFDEWIEEAEMAHVGVIIPANAKQVAIHYYGDYAYFAAVDAVTVREAQTYTVSAEPSLDPDNDQQPMGTVESTPETLGEMLEFTEVSVSAEPNFGYTFEGWIDDNGEPVSAESTYQFTVTGNTNLTASFDYIDFSVLCVVMPEEQGPGHGSFTQAVNTGRIGSTITITAVPETGYQFDGWYTFDGEDYTLIEDAGASYEVTISDDLDWNDDYAVSYYAHFSQITYTVTMATNPAELANIAGLVSISHNLLFGTGLDITLDEIDACYDFDKWTVNGVVFNTGDAEGITILGNQIAGLEPNGSIAVVANLQVKTYNVSVAVADGQNGYGTVSGSTQGVECGDQVTISANASTGYTFAGWIDADNASSADFVSTQNPLTITGINSNINYKASFTVNQYTVTANSNDNTMGIVSGGGQYNHGDHLNLTATANNGYHFVNWKIGENIVGTSATLSGNLAPTVTAPVTVTGYFAPDTYAYDDATIGGGDDPVVITDGNGDPVGPNNPFVYGQNYTYRVNVSSCYNFVKWVIDGSEYTTNPATVQCTGVPVATYYTSIKTYTVAATAGDNGSANVAPAANADGSYNCNTYVTLTATPNTHYNFAGWYNGEVLLNENATWSFYVSENVTAQAVFEPETYNFEDATVSGGDDPVVITDENGDPVGPDNPFVYGENYTYGVTVASCYNFVKWVIDGNEYTTNPATVQCTGVPVATYYTAIKTYSVTATAAANGSANVTTVANADGSYNCGSTVTLVATANNGYHFTGWYNGNDLLSQTATWNATVNANITAEARFAVNNYTVTVNYDAELGTVKRNNADVANGTSFDVDYNTELTFTAEYLPGNRFSQWSDGSTNISTATITYSVATYKPTLANNSTVTLTATFADAGSAVVSATANNSDWGHFTGTGVFSVDESFTVTAVPETGYEFLYWEDDETNTNPVRTGTVALGTTEYNFHAVFGPVTIVPTLTVYGPTGTASADFGSIAVTADQAGTTVLTGSDIYYGRTVYLQGIPAQHYHLDYWVVNGDINQNDEVVEVTVGTTLAAELHVAIDRHQLTVVAGAHGTVSGSGLFDYGTDHQIGATADENYHFVEWNDHNTNNPRTVTVTGNVTYTATFMGNTVVPTVSVVDQTENTSSNALVGYKDADGNALTSSDIYFGRTVVLNATINEHYHFTKWVVNGTQYNTAAPSVEVTNPMTIVLHIGIDSHNVAVAAVNGTVTGTGRYAYGATANLTATANEHYDFLGWYNGQTQLGTAANYSFTVTGDVNYTASFGQHQYAIGTGTNVEGGHATVTGNTTYGTTVTILAVADAHRHFVEWLPDHSTSNPRYEIVEGDAEFIPVFAIDQHSVTVASNNGNWGTVTGSGTYNYGSHVTVTATPADNYRFVRWTNAAGEEVSTDAEYSFDILDTDDETIAPETAFSLTAVFELNQVQITVTSGDPEHGTVAGTGSYTVGTTATISATATAEGWHFAGWSDNNTDNPREIVVTEAMNLTANFAINTYEVSISATEGGSIEGLEEVEEYYHGLELTLTAVADEGYHFTGWSDNVEDAERTITVTGPLTLTANFAVDVFEVSVTAGDSEMGSVTVTGLNADGTANYGSTITLTAVPAPGYDHVGWSDDETNTENPRQIVVYGPIDIQALFEQHMYTLTVNYDAERGTVTGAGQYSYGQEATLVATGAEHLHFAHWNDGNEQATRTVVVTSDTVFSAFFNYNVYTVTTAVQGNGTVEGAGQYTYGTSVELIATAAEGSVFAQWSDGNTQNPRSEVVEGDITYTAVFQATTFDVTILSDDVTITGLNADGSANYGSTITITAGEVEHMHFVEWSDHNTDNPRTIVVTGDITLEPVYAFDSYTLSVTSNDINMGIVSGAGEYEYGQTVTISAIAAEHYHFVEWSDHNTDNPRTLMLEADLDLTATFAADIYNVAIICDPQMGSVEGAGPYAYNTPATVSVTAANGYVFAGWTVNGQVVSTDATYTFTVEGNVTLTATFTAVQMVNVAVSYNSNQGTVTGAGQYAVGSTVTLTAIAANGYRFVRWSDGNTDNPRTFTATADITLEAIFEAEVGIDDVDMSQVTISSVDSKIVVRGAEGMSIYVFDVNGRVIERVNNASDNTEFRMANTGVYLVKVGTAAAKRVVVVR